MPHVLSLPCPAKVNLALSVGPRDDSGYHPIASWMLAVAFRDELSLRAASGPSAFEIAFPPDAPRPEGRPMVVDWSIDADLAVRAHRLMESHVGRPLPVSATLGKRIPTGAGLGGGSSDAAAMLVGLDRLFDLRLATAALSDLGARLGSDVPFFVHVQRHGIASALVSGGGERVEPMTLGQPIDLVLVLPPLRCPTGSVYAALDEHRPAAPPADLPRVRALAQRGVVSCDHLFNDLAAPATRVAPDLASLRDRVSSAAGAAAHVTGSGAALFVLADSPDHAAALAARITAATSLTAETTRSWSAPPAAGRSADAATA